MTRRGRSIDEQSVREAMHDEPTDSRRTPRQQAVQERLRKNPHLSRRKKKFPNGPTARPYPRASAIRS